MTTPLSDDGTSHISYLGNGSQSVFSVTFPFYRSGDLVVLVDGLPQTSGYTLGGDCAGGHGTLTLAAPLADGSQLTIIRNSRLQRLSTFADGGVLRARTLNEELDNIMAGLQDLAVNLQRSLRLSLAGGMDDSSSAELPDSGQRAGRLLGFDDSGAPALSAVASLGQLDQMVSDLLLEQANGSPPVYVDTFAKMRNREPAGSMAVVVAGYYAPGDGGGGTWRWVENNSLTADNGLVATSAVAGYGYGRWVRDNSETPLSVRAFGARGDGSSDDTLALQSWLNALVSRQVSGLMPAGQYRLTQPLLLSAAAMPNIHGEGGARSQINHSGLANGTAALTLRGTGSDQPAAVIYGIGFVGTSGTTGVEVQNVHHLTLESLYFGSQKYGIVLHNAISNDTCVNVISRDCVFLPDCLTALQYKVTSGDIWFRYSGLQGAYVSNSGVGPAIHIAPGARPAHAHLDMTLRQEAAAANGVIWHENTSANTATFVGALRVEPRTASSLASLGKGGAIHFAGSITSCGQGSTGQIMTGTLVHCRSFLHSEGSVVSAAAQTQIYRYIHTAGPGGTIDISPVNAVFATMGTFVSIYAYASGYAWRAVYFVALATTGGTTGTPCKICDAYFQDSLGWGMPTVSSPTNKTLVITHPSWNNVIVYYSYQHFNGGITAG